MSSISAHLLSRSASCRRLGFTRLSSYISSISHLTDAESQLYFEHFDAKSRLRAQQPPCRISQGRPAPCFVRPQIHDARSSSWVALERTKVQEGLERGKLLKVVSWNIEAFGPGQAARVSAALDHLKGLFGGEPGSLVVMLQEVRRESLQAIMDTSWVQRNFVLYNVKPPESICTDIAGDSFVLRSSNGALTQSKIIAGLVGGDMNALEKSEHLFHKESDIDLSDVWEDVPAPPTPVLKPFQKDFSYGQARGNTWGYQSKSRRERKRMDKFFYTGSLETVAVHEAQDITGRLGRLGIGLKTEVGAWEFEYKGLKQSPLRRGKYVEEPQKIYFSESAVAKFPDEERRGLVHRKLNVWVSDHFGVAVGIKVL
ncbi:hypothetical protein GJ744_003772 [Endocarpon pusillum]|uniref:Endonuclease/exonuclease/phosphatase domain-containing protein n=1 Tax=Endocarpon pusillum TaxID=364733 RepID=A0A8H7AQD1_9EURO|nr:hypothetical protein GJ744_003772 [Endocarpon pusillum]